MSSGPSVLDLIRQTTEAIAEFIEWLVALLRNDDWFKLLVLAGVGLSLLGTVFKELLVSLWPGDAVPDALWVSLWTAATLAFVSAFVVALVKRPGRDRTTTADTAERRAIKGLRPFGAEDVEIFAQLQRQASLRECLESVTSPNYKFGILMGESGCGKTSFLQAGLWPKLQAEDCSHRGVLVRFSDQEPLETIRKALVAEIGLSPDTGLSTDGRSSQGSPLSPPFPRGEAGSSSVQGHLGGSPFLHLLHQAVATSGKPIVLLCDQFEQVFVHYRRPEDRAPFIQALTDWYKTPALDTVKLLVSIRADLLHELYVLQSSLKYTLGPYDQIKLERFTPAEAVKILGVIAQTENLEFDPRFVEELATQELANSEDGTVSPVDLQILAWMIERQKSDDLRAFNREAFQKFGGVEGLLTRFLERTLEVRVLPNQREVAIKTLLALTDLDRQVRAGVLTLPELAAKLQGDMRLEDIADAVNWLARSDVRLITPQEKSSATGYELAHERLIPALLRLAGRELTAADQANQLLERRVNEWLGNRQSARYLLSPRELWQIRRQRPFLIWGAKRKQKERLLYLSRHRYYSMVGVVGAFALVGMLFWGWWHYTPQGHVQQVKWELSRIVNRASDQQKAQIAVVYIKNNQQQKGLSLLETQVSSQESRSNALRQIASVVPRLPAQRQPLPLLERVTEIVTGMDAALAKANALSAIASTYGQLGESHATAATAVLAEALAVATNIDASWWVKSAALSGIASAYGQLGKHHATAAAAGLEQALAVTSDIDDARNKAYALSAIASAYGQLGERHATKAAAVLEQALTVASDITAPVNMFFGEGVGAKADTLRAIASAYGQLGESHATDAAAGLEQVITVVSNIDDARDKSITLSTIASAYGQLGERHANDAVAVLEQALTVASNITSPINMLFIDDASAKSAALSAIASAYGQLGEHHANDAVAGLEQVIAVASNIDDASAKSAALSAIASAYGQLGESHATEAAVVLEQALAVATDIDAAFAKANALSAIASAYGQLGERHAIEAAAVLEQALTVATDIDDARSKAYRLSVIASAYGQLGDRSAVHAGLIEVRRIAEQSSLYGNDLLSQIAAYQALYGSWGDAWRTLRRASDSDRLTAMTQMLTYYAESKTPQLIEGPVVLQVSSAPAGASQHTLAVEIQSPDESCEKHADWWEVLTEDGEFVDRRLIENGPHPFEGPFTTEQTIGGDSNVDPNQVLIIRAHFSSPFGETYNQQEQIITDSSRYSSQAMKGSINRGFKSVRMPPRFAAGVERQDPQPEACRAN